MTDEQKEAVTRRLKGVSEFHHGDCVGADAEAHDIAYDVHQPVIVVHPPLNEKGRAFKQGDVILPQREYQDRNHDIVDATDYLIATPDSYTEKFRGSGTWATIRYAVKKGKTVYVIYPDGSTRIQGRMVGT